MTRTLSSVTLRWQATMTVMDSGLISIVRNVKIVSRFHRSCHVFVIVSVTVTLYLPLSLRLPFDLCLSVGQIKHTHTHSPVVCHLACPLPSALVFHLRKRRRNYENFFCLISILLKVHTRR